MERPAAGIDEASPIGAGWQAAAAGRSDLGSYLPATAAPTLHRGLARKARPPPSKKNHIRVHKK